jgi:hypothetical protein
MVVSVILADVEPARPARRQKPRPAANPVKSGVSTMRTVLSGRQDAALYGRRDARRYIFRRVIRPTETARSLPGKTVGCLPQRAEPWSRRC